MNQFGNATDDEGTDEKPQPDDTTRMQRAIVRATWSRRCHLAKFIFLDTPKHPAMWAALSGMGSHRNLFVAAQAFFDGDRLLAEGRSKSW